MIILRFPEDPPPPKERNNFFIRFLKFLGLIK